MSDPANAPKPPSDTPPPEPRDATLLQVVGAVFWSFFGVRKGTAMSRDTVTIKPLHVIIVGVLLAAVLVFVLLGIVRIIIRTAA
jgi:hypothetical protein